MSKHICLSCQAELMHKDSKVKNVTDMHCYGEIGHCQCECTKNKNGARTVIIKPDVVGVENGETI